MPKPTSYPMNPDSLQMLRIAEVREALKTEVYVIVDELTKQYLPMYSDVLRLSMDERRTLYRLMLKAFAKRIELVDV